MTLTLNTKSGVLHWSRRCAGQDTRFHYRVRLDDSETLLAIIGWKFTGLCRKEFGR